MNEKDVLDEFFVLIGKKVFFFFKLNGSTDIVFTFVYL